MRKESQMDKQHEHENKHEHAHGRGAANDAPWDHRQQSGDDAGAQSGQRRRRDAGTRLIEFADSLIRPVRDRAGRTYVTFPSRPHEAVPHDGSSSSRAVLAVCEAWHVANGDWPGAGARASLASWLTAKSLGLPVEEVHLRCAFVEGVLYLDTGWPSWEIIRVDRSGPSVVSEAPVLFSRSDVCGALPDPRVAAAPLHSLLGFVRMHRRDLPIAVAVLLCSWFPDLPQPVLALLGGAGSGKTMGMSMLLDLVDPSTGRAGTEPTKDIRELKALAAMRRVLVFDNVSYLDGETSDHLARMATGSELVSRALYTNDAAHVSVLMRPIWLNGIMTGFSRGDLASRTIALTLDTVPDTERRAASRLAAEWSEAKAGIFRALLDMVASLIADTSEVEAASAHRNADLMRVLAHVDRQMGTSSGRRVEGGRRMLIEVVLSASPLADGLRRAIECARSDGGCRCTPAGRSIFNENDLGEIRAIIEAHGDDDLDRHNRHNGKSLADLLVRISPDLEAATQVRMSKRRISAGMRYTFHDLKAR